MALSCYNLFRNEQKVNNLTVSSDLLDFVNNTLLKDTNIIKENFWLGFDKALHELAPINKGLLEIREKLQLKIDEWHKTKKGEIFNIIEYQNFLIEIGYLKKLGPDFKIKTKNIDDEISKIAGPQLVVPIMNARYALNAANARWMSLYDSLYGTDVIKSEEGGSERYDPLRGQEVIRYGRNFLNKYFPIENIHWKDITSLIIKDSFLIINKDEKENKLKNIDKFIGYRGPEDKPTAVILKNNNLHVEIIINPKAFSATHDVAGISDI